MLCQMVLACSKLIRYFRTFRSLGLKRAIKTVHHRLVHRNKAAPSYSRATHTVPIVQRRLQFLHNLAIESVPIETIESWHCDPKLSQHNHAFCFDPSIYHKDIKLPLNAGKKLGPDIRNLWQVGRCYQLPLLAKSYLLSGDEKYLNACKAQINSFLDANSFLHGPHWFNGMEVGLRAINWICAVQYLHDVLKNDASFYDRLIAALFDHMNYLEHNWEWYDGRTNNHYLSNLVAYAYLLWFFQDQPHLKKKWRWCYQQLLDEFEWQVFDEGTSYEGSTAYHQFVTELFLHAFLIAQEMGEQIPLHVHAKLERMVLFIYELKPSEYEKIVAIGDDDSSVVTYMISIESLAAALHIYPKINDAIVHYSAFGLSIHRSKKWHITLRHASYNARQPTAHFHQDAGSITIAYDGNPLIIDPGTFTYTGSSYWRNYFRSFQSHSTVYADQDVLSSDLFSMPLNAQTCYIDISENIIKTEFACGQGAIIRTVRQDDLSVTISDCYSGPKQTVAWNIMLHPAVQLFHEHSSWRIVTHAGQEFLLQADLPLEAQEAYYSHRYAQQQKANRLTAHHCLEDGMQLQICLSRL